MKFTESCGNKAPELINDESSIHKNPESINYFNFGRALEELKNGIAVTRKGWNGRGLKVVFQKGYPDGIPCNKQTADAWGIEEGSMFKCEPYFQISTVDGSHAMWVPSIRDCLAEDWCIASNTNSSTNHGHPKYMDIDDIPKQGGY